ncbi:MAG TPA: DNA-directed RNA polymerase subunit alpha [Acholeplasmataceae bacterium]|nr:DNA-directed RNA polymerase subunit alpha [Acholeplasmataceae bacterium]
MRKLLFELPTSVEEISKDGNKARFVIKPLERGYGTTIGNALRRVLLSSMPGAAIVNVEIDGVQHEFTTIPGVFEDVMGIILNLKEVIISVDSDDVDFEQKLYLNVQGPKVVTAGDFERVTGVNIINPDLIIANLNEVGSLSMVVTVRRGVGYVSADENKIHSGNQVGLIAIDSLYSPILRVAYSIEKTRGDDDELTLEVETNGAIEAKDAIAMAAKILIDHFDIIVQISERAGQIEFIKEEEEDEENQAHLMKIEELDMSVRLFNALKRAGISTVGGLLKMREEEIIKIRNLGRKSMKELKECLAEHNLELKSSYIDDYDSEDYDE